MDEEIKRTYNTLTERLARSTERRNRLQQELQDANIEVDQLTSIVKGLQILYGTELNIDSHKQQNDSDLAFSGLSIPKKILTFLKDKKRVTINETVDFLKQKGEPDYYGKDPIRKKITDIFYRMRKDGTLRNSGQKKGYNAYELVEEPPF